MDSRGKGEFERVRWHRKKIVCQEKLQTHPLDVESHWQRGMLYFLEDDPFRALEDFTLVIRLRPSFSLAYYYRGIVYLKHRRYREAEEDFSMYLQHNPHDPMGQDALRQTQQDR